MNGEEEVVSVNSIHPCLLNARQTSKAFGTVYPRAKVEGRQKSRGEKDKGDVGQ